MCAITHINQFTFDQELVAAHFEPAEQERLYPQLVSTFWASICLPW